MNVKQNLLQEIRAAREELWALLDQLDDSTVIYPGWKKREFYTHVAGWEAMVFDIFRRYLAGQPPADYGYTDVDSANVRYVATRQSMTVDDAKLECDINRFAILTQLDSIDDYERVVPFPWGEETIISFLMGAIEHERIHAADIQKLRVSN